jgi:inosose dehydratase
MKIGYQTITWRGDVEKAFRDISDIGFSYVEIAGLHGIDNHKDMIPVLLERYKLSLLAAYFGGTYINPDLYKYERKNFMEICHFIESLGGKYVVVGGGQKREEGNTPADYVTLANALNDMGDQSDKNNIQLCYHPHVGTMVEYSEQIAEIVEKTDSSLVSLCFDTAHLASNGVDIVEICKQYSARLVYMHFKDINKSRRFVELGKGKIDFQIILETLWGIGYDGPIVAELDASVDERESCKSNKIFLENLMGKPLN